MYLYVCVYYKQFRVFSKFCLSIKKLFKIFVHIHVFYVRVLKIITRKRPDFNFVKDERGSNGEGESDELA